MFNGKAGESAVEPLDLPRAMGYEQKKKTKLK